MCADLGDLCYRDERCASVEDDPFSGLGCNAGGAGQLCRFCGFDQFPACPAPLPVVTANFTTLQLTCPTVCGPDPIADRCVYDPVCHADQTGCNAGGHEFCRFCGGTGQPECPCHHGTALAEVNKLQTDLDTNAIGNFEPGSVLVEHEVNMVVSMVLAVPDHNISFRLFDFFSGHAQEMLCLGRVGCSAAVQWESPPTDQARRQQAEGAWDQSAVVIEQIRPMDGCDDREYREMDALMQNGTNGSALIAHIRSFADKVDPGFEPFGTGGHARQLQSAAPAVGWDALSLRRTSHTLHTHVRVVILSSAYPRYTDPNDRADHECDLFQAAGKATVSAVPTHSSVPVSVRLAYEGSLKRNHSLVVAQGNDIPCGIAEYAITERSPSPPLPPPPLLETQNPLPTPSQAPAPPLSDATSELEEAAGAAGGGMGMIAAAAGAGILFICVFIMCRGRLRRRSAPSDDLARDKPVAASAYEDGSCRPANAVDANAHTWWSSGPVGDTEQQWIAVDLLETINLTEVRVTWEKASSQQYLIQGSMDALVWRTLRQVTHTKAGQAAQIITDVSGRQARFVRILCLKLPAGEVGYTIRALEAYGSPAGPEFDSLTPLSVSGMITPASDPATGTITPDDQLLSDQGVIRWPEVRLTELLGSSRSDFGHVYRASYRNKPTAVRRLGPQMLATQGASSVREEVIQLSALEHPCLLKMIGFVSDGAHNHGILMEFQARSLQDVLESPFAMSLDWSTAWLGISIGIADGMAYLHSKGLLHCCLRPHNVMLDDQLSAKITDYGRNVKMLAAVRMSLNQAEEESDPSGEPVQAYSAPEVLHGSDVEKSGDSWSFGCILARLGSNVPLYSSVGDVSWYILMLRVCSGQVTPLSELRQAIDCPKEIFLLASHCLNLDPKKRLSFARIKLLLTRIRVHGPTTGDMLTPDLDDSPGGKQDPGSSLKRGSSASKKKGATPGDARRGSVHVVPARLPAPPTSSSPDSTAKLSAPPTASAPVLSAPPLSAPPPGLSSKKSLEPGPKHRKSAPMPAAGEEAPKRKSKAPASLESGGADSSAPGPSTKPKARTKSDAGSSATRQEVVLGESIKAKQVRAGRVRI